MKKSEFMRQLESLLQDIPPAEREEALQYYNDYFDDAGTEKEKEVIDTLGDPVKIAENIKRDLLGEDRVQAATIKNPPLKYQDESSQEQTNYHMPTEDKSEGGLFHRIGAWFKALPTWGKILTIIVGILLTPVIISIASFIISAAFSLITGWFSLILGFAVASLALFISLIILLIIGFMFLTQVPMGGVAFIGAGLICGGIGILFMMLTVAMIKIATPAIFKGILKLCKRVGGKKEVTS